MDPNEKWADRSPPRLSELTLPAPSLDPARRWDQPNSSAAGFDWYVWRELGDVEIVIHGYPSGGIGVAVTLALGVGLMWLVYCSRRRDCNDKAGRI
jgi:hypothetical protein